MNKKIKYYLFFINILFLSSCETYEDKLYKKIVGQWAIDKIEYEGQNIKDNLMINFMAFNESVFSIPEIGNYPAEHFKDSTQWKIITKNDKEPTLTLKCKNPIFNGTYKLKFFKKEDKNLLSIVIKSGTTLIIADKFFQNFEINGKDWEMEKNASR